MRLTRREWGVALAAGAASRSGAQTAARQSRTPEQLVQEAAAGNRRMAANLAKVKLAMAVEPAFLFRA